MPTLGVGFQCLLCVPIVLQAKHIPSIKIVSYDWLEDSLMNHRPLREDPYYLMKRRVLRDSEKRAKKKGIRKQNIKRGSKFFYLYRYGAHKLIRGGSEAFREGLSRIQRSHGFR